MRALILTISVMTLTISAIAQTDVQGLLYGPQPKLLKDLDGTWTHMAVWDASVQQPSGMAAAFSGDQSEYVCYTQGKTIRQNGRTFLIAYRVKSTKPDPAKLAGLFNSYSATGAKGSNPFEIFYPKRTPETPLSLVLLDMEALAEATDIRPAALASEITEQDLTGQSSVAIMAAILFPVFAQARERARETSSLSNLKYIALGTLMYAQDWDERLPPMKDSASVKKAIMPYVKSEAVFIDPRTQQPYKTNPAMSKKLQAAILIPAQTALFYEGTAAPDGRRGVAFADGHAKRVTESEWTVVKRKSGIP